MSEYQNLFGALAKAQGDMGKLIAGSTATIKSDKANYSYKYANLADVLDVALKALSPHALGIMQFPEVTFEDKATVVSVGSTLFHGSGEYMVIPPFTLRIRPGATAQEIGSAITYARRYQLQSVLGLSPDEDDDGKAASQTQDKPQAVKPAKATQAQNGTQAQHRTPQQVPAPADVQELAGSIGATVTEVDDPETALGNARRRFHTEVISTFSANDADDARHWLIEAYTTKTTPDNVRKSTNDLNIDELSALTEALKKHRKTYRDRWIAEKTHPIPADKQPVTA